MFIEYSSTYPSSTYYSTRARTRVARVLVHLHGLEYVREYCEVEATVPPECLLKFSLTERKHPVPQRVNDAAMFASMFAAVGDTFSLSTPRCPIVM